MVKALHLTPGRRLLGCLQKLKSCMQIPSLTAPMHRLVTPLLDLLKDKGDSTSSVEALAEAVGCEQDEARSNVNQLMMPLVHAMMSCSDYKVRDMGHRQELKFVVTTTNSGCSHRQCDKTIKKEHYAATLKLKQFEGGEVSSVQNAVTNSLHTEFKQTCDQCKVENVLSLRRQIKAHCDPDFLTLFFDEPRSLQQSDLILQFSESTYAVKVVTHWDEERQKSAVSVQRSDGWWWHGIDMDQASHYRYSERETSSGKPFSKAIVLMCVRVVPYANYGGNGDNTEDIESSQGETDSWENKDVDDDEASDIWDWEEDECDFIGKDLIEEENQTRKKLRYDGEGGYPNLSHKFGSAAFESQQNGVDNGQGRDMMVRMEEDGDCQVTKQQHTNFNDDQRQIHAEEGNQYPFNLFIELFQKLLQRPS